MTTIDLNTQQQWEELLQRVEAGESVRIVRGAREVAFIEPAQVRAEDDSYLDALAQMGLQQLADAFPPNEFDDWKQPDGTR